MEAKICFSTAGLPINVICNLGRYESYELYKLAEWLKTNGYIYKLRDQYCDGTITQVIVFDEEAHKLWDAAYNNGTFGHDNGLLETYGNFCNHPDLRDDACVGYLSANQIIDIIEGKKTLEEVIKSNAESGLYSLMLMSSMWKDDAWSDEDDEEEDGNVGE